MLSAKTFFQLTSVIFCVVGLLHIIRIFTGYVLIYDTWSVPAWLSFVAGLFLWYLSYVAYQFSKKRK